MKNPIVKDQTDSTDQQTKWEIKCLRIWEERVSHPSSQITRMLSLHVFNLLPRCLQDPWPTSGCSQLPEQCTPGLCAYIHKNACFPRGFKHIPVPTSRGWVQKLVSALPPQILAKMHCLFQRLFPRLSPIKFWEWPIWNKEGTMTSNHH